MDNIEIKKVLSTNSNDHCMEYKKFFESHGYTVHCEEKQNEFGDQKYTVNAIKKVSSEDSSDTDIIDAIIHKHDSTIEIRTFSRKVDKTDKLTTSINPPNTPKPKPSSSLNQENETEECDKWAEFEQSLQKDIDEFKKDHIDRDTSQDKETDSFMNMMDADIPEFDTHERSNKKYTMEDNMMRMKSTLTEKSISKEQAESLMNITKNLYKNITRIWGVADTLGKNIRELGNKYRIICLENRSLRLKYQRLVVKLNALNQDTDYLKQVKERYLRCRTEYDKQTSSNNVKDEHIAKLKREIETLRKLKKMDADSVDDLKNTYERHLQELNSKLSSNQSKIDELTATSSETKTYIDNSSKLIDTMMEKRDCKDLLRGAGPIKHKTERRKQNLCILKQYVNPPLAAIVDTNIEQWGVLNNHLYSMNHILNLTANDITQTCKNHHFTIPEPICKHKLEKMYILFLYQLHSLKIVPSKYVSIIADILDLPKNIKSSKQLKKYFHSDIQRIVKMLR